MALHANAAAAAALKLQCYVQALEHCDKVLHLADVLHNTPQHPLCVKALQRRAAARQALGQHSKAVEDLTEAAAMLPGDKELTEQLARAQLLLQESRAAKRQASLVASSSTAGAAAAANQQSDSGSPAAAAAGLPEAEPSLAALQQVERLVQALAQPGSGGTAAAAAAAAAQAAGACTTTVAAACQQLRQLLSAVPSCIAYFKECGGLAAAAKQVLRLSLLSNCLLLPAGNAALVLGHFAGEPCWHPQLRSADAVGVLVAVAYAHGRGSAVARNAAIGLARMGHDAEMMERLRELHGIEIIYQYVRP
ncbi:hypothetical protein OEZ85_013473 [Tetradesmus obliquus]|uniref:Uncharacterized protein n=1 Tax=Tetradesmus obliquus TaxID=3088 RepID=A0ABY8UW84_TETOB|nr:hypothetical protein OEZ85_013473 [Tetradesmus obliquus]